MSFFKKMKDKFEDLVGDDDDKKKDDKKEEKVEGTKDQGSYSQQQQPYGKPAPYGQQQTYGAPPSHPPSSGGPPQLPPGWISQWDPNSQRYYYLEQATGRTQWDPPQPYNQSGFAPPPMGAPNMGHDSYGGQQGQPTGYYSQETTQTFQDPHGGGMKEVTQKTEKKSGKGGMLAAGAGGLAVGAVGGAVLAHEMGEDSSDDEHHGQAYQQQQPAYVQQQQNYYQEPGPPPLEAPPPGDHSSVSSSDKEDLAEAREDYENASDASDREEAREDYNEAYEEAYD